MTSALAVLTDPVPGQPAGAGLGGAALIGLYVVLPLAIFALISVLALAPAALRRQRYRPGWGWTAEPLWFGGPDTPEQAVREARPGELVTGGASGGW